jgi:N6-adenosine-specific RNA methylase IME4
VSEGIAVIPGLTPTGLSLPEGLPVEHWISIGQQLRAMERSVQWWVGDWIRFGEHAYGEKYAEALAATGYAYQTLANASWMSGEFESSRRRESLSFEHHKAVARLDSSEQDELLDLAADAGWSTRDLLAEVRRRKNADAIGVESTDANTVADLDVLIQRGMRFGTIYADPPWQYGNQGTRGATSDHYNGMTVEAIRALPVPQLAADNAHLHLWTTNAFLFDCKAIIESWGFEYKSCYIWVKPQMGMGNYWRVSHEFMLFGIRGKAPFGSRAEMSWGKFNRGKHSAKPDDIRRLVERVSPGPRLEMFGRKAVPGWTVWGNQVEPDIFAQQLEATA